MTEAEIETKENRCSHCKELTKQSFRIGVCDFCYEILEPIDEITHDNTVMRYKEIDFFSPIYEKLGTEAMLMLWLSYLTDNKAIKMWHGTFQLEKDKQGYAMKTPMELFEKFAVASLSQITNKYMRLSAAKLAHK